MTREQLAADTSTSEPTADRRGRVVFVGAVHEAEPALAALLAGPAEVVAVVTLPLSSGGLPSGHVDLEPLALAHAVPVHRCSDVNAPADVAWVRGLAPDLLVVVGWTRLIGPELLAVPTRGCVGFHASLLPRYRGRAPVNWAIIRGETETGNTMMLLDAGTDTGDIVDQERVAIGPDDTCASVYAKVAQSGAEMLVRRLPQLLAGTAGRRKQGRGDGELLRKRTPDMGVTDWSRPGVAVHDWIRALTSPYPGAFTHRDDRKVMLGGSAVAPGRGRAAPGEVIGLHQEGIAVACGSGAVLVTAMSDEGSSALPARAWAAAHGLAVGDRFELVDRETARWALGLDPEHANVGVG